MKRAFDILLAAAGLLATSPVILLCMWLVWLQDFESPFYVAPRMARGGGTFRMVKLRSMVRNADRNGVVSTSATDQRITPVGRWIRAFKIDELVQLWNVLVGDMSLVGPRPQVPRDASLYTAEEQKLLSVRPGITDLASIVFADEGDVLAEAPDPDLRYNQVIRPWKSRLALLYIDRAGLLTDLRIIFLTAIGLVSRGSALEGVQAVLTEWKANELVRRMARRSQPLVPYPPPGAMEVVSALPQESAPEPSRVS